MSLGNLFLGWGIEKETPKRISGREVYSYSIKALIAFLVLVLLSWLNPRC